MVFVEDPPRIHDVEVVFGGVGPRQFDQPVEVSPRHRVLGRHAAHLRQPVELLLRDLLHLRRHVRLEHLLPELIYLRISFVALAKLLLDRLELLPQIVFSLGLIDAFFNVGLYLARKLQGLQLAVEHHRNFLKPFLQVDLFQHFLPFGDADIDRRRDKVREVPWALYFRRDLRKLRRQVGSYLHRLLI